MIRRIDRLQTQAEGPAAPGEAAGRQEPVAVQRNVREHEAVRVLEEVDHCAAGDLVQVGDGDVGGGVGLAPDDAVGVGGGVGGESAEAEAGAGV